MRIIAVTTLKHFWEQPGHRDVEQSLLSWIAVTKAARWTQPADIKATFNTVDILKGGRAVFDIGGNKYRIVAHINYRHHIVYIRFIGTHRQYDKIDAQSI